MAAVLLQEDFLDPFELAFLQAVLEIRGVRGKPALPELRGALETMEAYSQQREDNPPAPETEAWLARLAVEERAALCARAFLDFGATKPTAQQWQLAHRACFGPLLCATCN